MFEPYAWLWLMAAGAGLVLVAALIIVWGASYADRNNLIVDDAPGVKRTRRTRFVQLGEGGYVHHYYEPDDPGSTALARLLRDIYSQPTRARKATRIAMYLRLWSAVAVSAVLIVAGFGMAAIGIVEALTGFL